MTRTVTIDGKGIAYDDETTVFRVDVGRYAKEAYTTKYEFVGMPYPAVMHYQAINLGRSYKKRLLLIYPGHKPIVLAREAS